MGGCGAIKPNGELCRGIARAGSDWCPAHDPDRAAARKAAARLAGKSRPSQEIRRVKDRLLGLADDVLAGSVGRPEAAVAAQIFNAYLRALEIERRTLDMGDLLERLAALEERAETLRRGA